MVLLALLGTVFSAVIQGFIESFLEEYLKIFNLSVTSIGLSFLCKLIILLIVSCRLRPPYKINSQQIGLLTPLYGIFITIFCDTYSKLLNCLNQGFWLVIYQPVDTNLPEIFLKLKVINNSSKYKDSVNKDNYIKTGQ